MSVEQAQAISYLINQMGLKAYQTWIYSQAEESLGFNFFDSQHKERYLNNRYECIQKIDEIIMNHYILVKSVFDSEDNSEV